MIPLEPIFDLVRQPILAIGPKGHWIYSNLAFSELLGLEEGGASGAPPPFSWWPLEFGEDYGALLGRMITDGDPKAVGRTWRVELLHTAGHRVSVSLMYQMIPDRDESPLAHLFLAMDVPESEGVPRRYSEGLDRIARELAKLGVAPHGSRGRDRSPRTDLLSPRESEVLSELLGGATVRDIAAKLVISAYTVRNHLKSIYRKLGVHSQRELLVCFRDAT